MNSGEIQSKIKEVQEKMNTKDMKILKKRDEEEYVKEMKSNFEEFSEDYPGLFDKILNGTIQDKQFQNMLFLLKKMEGGEMSEHDASVQVGQNLVDEFVKPVLPNDKD